MIFVILLGVNLLTFFSIILINEFRQKIDSELLTCRKIKCRIKLAACPVRYLYGEILGITI